jgi:O-antigen/teichoic acid export membrane protein
MEKKSKKLLVGSAMRSANLLAQVLVGFCLMPYLIYSLGDRMYGLWSLVAAFLGYYGLVDFGLTSATIRFMSGAIGEGDEKKCNEVFNTAVILFTALGAIVVVITLIIALLGRLFFTVPSEILLFRQVVLILGASVGLSFPVRAFRGVLASQLRFDITSYVAIFELLIRTALIIVVLQLGYGLLGMALVSFFVAIPSSFLLIYYAKKNLPFLRFGIDHFKRSRMRSLFSYSIITFIVQISEQVRYNIDPLVIASFINLSAVTHYKIAGELFRYYVMLIVSFVGVFQPVFSRLDAAKKHDSIVNTFFYATKLSIYLSVFVAFGFVFWGKSFIVLWVGMEYLDAYPCLVLLVLAGVCMLSQMPSVNLLYGISKHHFYAIANSIEAIINLALSIILAPRYGILGIAFGTFLPLFVIRLFVQPICVCRICSIPLRSYIIHCIKAVFVCSAGLVVPVILSFFFVSPSYISLITVGAISLSCYSFIVIWLGFDIQEKKRLPYYGSLNFFSKTSL